MIAIPLLALLWVVLPPPASDPYAIALLASPPDTPVPAVSPEVFARLAPALRRVALAREILDPRETCVLGRPEDWECDLGLLRRRWQNLQDAPPLRDAARWPCRDFLADGLAFNRAYHDNLGARASIEPRWCSELWDAMEEADRLYRAWDLARDVQADYYYVTFRREALDRLRQQLGPAAYHAGRLPPCVPLWRFRTFE